METNQNMQKGIRNLLMRILTGLIVLLLSFNVCNTPKVLAAEEPTEDITKKLTLDLWYVEELLYRITTTPYSNELYGEAIRVLDETEGILENYPNIIPDLHAYYNKQKEELDRYDTAITGATEKLETLKISKDMDISQVIGFTADELEQILLNGRDKQGNILVTDDEFARELAEGIVELVKTYPVNEMAIIAIMSFETRHFTSSALRKDHNYAGDMYNGKIIHYASNDEGISKAVEYIYKNMIATGPTIRDVNMKYCEIDDPPEGGETEQEKEERVYRWANKVVGTMRMYAKIER